MAKTEYTWPVESFDAIGIRARDVNIGIRGTDADEVRLESDGSEKPTAKLNIERLGCWLWISIPTSSKNVGLSLMLPKQKTWPIDLYARSVNFEANDIWSRLNLVFAKGEVRLNDFHGAFNLASGNADVLVKGFIEKEVSEMPPLPDNERIKDRKPLALT